ncbi:hypothetical protein [Clavibacter michiganensis]|uniref:Uncharacterized protein n=1 Tax=Clavibacter michiganensis TaxID=28447 RepID=A0A251YGA7_9MICO|nr:hypothetical protein [Clavibacter michiganensis]OUE23159.1 hypothetical protein BFL37_14460 [Clavibacter michiganensis]
MVMRTVDSLSAGTEAGRVAAAAMPERPRSMTPRAPFTRKAEDTSWE